MTNLLLSNTLPWAIILCYCLSSVVGPVLDPKGDPDDVAAYKKLLLNDPCINPEPSRQASANQQCTSAWKVLENNPRFMNKFCRGAKNPGCSVKKSRRRCYVEKSRKLFGCKLWTSRLILQDCIARVVGDEPQD